MFRKFINRILFRRALKGDESVNVVNSMAKAQKLYKRLAVLAHPDNNPNNVERANELMQRIVENKKNYANLLLIEQEVITKLNKQL